MKDEVGKFTTIFLPRAFILHNSSFIIHPFPVVPDGVEPSFPGCRPGVVAVGPRDRHEWSHRGLHPDCRVADPASSCWTMTPTSGSRGTRTHKRLFAATCFPARAPLRPAAVP